MVRSLFHPKDCRRQFNRILEIEAAWGWRSTFFFLEGNRWSRYGSRYLLNDARIQEIAAMIKRSGCEIGVHGGYHDLNHAPGYRRSADRIEAAFKTRPIGIRNHMLRHDGIETWKAQERAGFVYDATFGYNDRVGFREGKMLPFRPCTPANVEGGKLLVLPLAAMDSAIFRSMRIRKEGALSVLRSLLDEVESVGGLLSVLWHNNYFDEPEYAEWEETYEAFLAMAAERRPWCATGAEIASHWAGTTARSQCLPMGGDTGLCAG
jgi:peptidoglycan/xylan/chitin deacetylase (PgdA/CDA1 family)